MKSQTTYVIGHRNPDADTVCAAVAYADFKNKTEKGRFVPARCGNSNARIDAILKRFGVPPPVFIGDVTPRVRDIMHTRILGASPCSTCAEALEKIDAHDIRVLPVLGKGGVLEGQIGLSDMGAFFVPKPNDLRALRRVRTHIRAVARALKAKVLYAKDEYKEEDLFVRVGAMDIRSFGRFAAEEGISPGQSVIIVGDRHDIQRKSIQLGVRLLIITGNLSFDESIVEMARKKGVCLMVSPYDSASTAWIVRTAGFVRTVMDTRLVKWLPEDKLSVLRRKIGAVSDVPLHYVVDEKNVLKGLFSRGDLLKPSLYRLILVDHNELSQAVPGAQEAEIVEIVDHHRLGNLKTDQPILFHNEPVGSTCTIVADMFRRHGTALDRKIAGLLMGGIISDTLNLQSPTAAAKDREILSWLSPIAKTNAGALARLIFASGSIIAGSSADAIIASDCKTYEDNGRRYSVSQVEELGYANFRAKSAEIQKALEAYRRREGLDFACILITDVNRQNSLLVVCGQEEIIRNIAYPTAENRKNIFELEGVVSRKKQLIPYLSALLHA